MLSILGFLAVLGPLVVVHELGHFFFARFFGVKAEVFSIGFGPKLWSRKKGETEWRVSAIPLGGYVKLLGEDGESDLPPELQKRTLQAQPPWKRFFVFFGGPLFNFLFAIVVFMAILLIGEPQLSSVIGRVVHHSEAEKAGLRSGDLVLSVNGKPVRRYDEMMNVVAENPDKPVKFEVRHRDGVANEVTLIPVSEEGYSIYGEEARVGEIGGIFPSPRAAVAGVSNPNSIAGKSGVKTGSWIAALNGKPVANWEELEEQYRALPAGASFQVRVGKLANEKPDPASGQDVTFVKPATSLSLGEDLGLHSSELFVDKALPKTPAEAAGIKNGDRLIGIGDKSVNSFFELRDAVQKAGERDGKVTIRFERDGKIIPVTVTPTASSMRDPTLKKMTQYTVGIAPQLIMAEPATFVERTLNPVMLVGKATSRMATFTWRNLVSLRKMITGDVSIATLGGPILIGKIAGESIARGLVAFLTTMAVLSVGLGILNVLPVPVLDGGHLLLLGIEAIRGKPLSMRQMEIIQQVGLSLILLLMIVVIRNDLTRLPIFN